MRRERVLVSGLAVVAAACGGGRNSPCGDGGHSAYMADGAWFLADVSCVDAADDSDAVIHALRGAGGWGNGDTFQIDFAIDVLHADGATPMMPFTPTDNWYDPDCDAGPMPVPVGGNVEDETGYACTHGGDCHLIVDDPGQHALYEMWKADLAGGTFDGGCLAVWSEDRVYGPKGRGDQCTSADAAGFPIAPLLFSADEVAAGHIDHAIRFTLPNDRVRRGYTRPATHGTQTTGDGSLPYYGVHLRLRADYPVDRLPSDGAQVVARALQTYGMYHADGGEIVLTAESDRHTQAKWSGLLDAHDLAALKVEDFEVIDHGAMIPLTLSCVRER
jgi:hypothetical protein